MGPRVLAQGSAAPRPPAGEGGAKRRVRVRLLMLPAKSRALTPTPLPKAGEGLPIARSVRRVTFPSPQSPVPPPPPMRIDIISLFPEFIAQVARHVVVGRAQERGLLSLLGWNPRDHAAGNYPRVADRPFGGRSEERRLGQECVSTCNSRWEQDH